MFFACYWIAHSLEALNVLHPERSYIALTLINLLEMDNQTQF